MTNPIWTPQPRQALFMARSENEVLYGGAAGGGKSDALVAEALRQVHIPWYKGLLLRKTFPELEELIGKSQRIYPAAFPGAKYNATSHTWRFPSGAMILFGSLQHTKDRTKYQGQAYDFIGFDELTHFLFEEYSFLTSRNRPNGPGTMVYTRASANPGGVGHGWVKERFITAAKPMETIWQPVSWIDNQGKKHSSWRSRAFVPSTVFDNAELLKNDPEYVATLAALPEADRQALLYGNWDTFEGQVFTEWRNDPEHYADRVNTHVINPFRIPGTWKVTCGLDWGYSKPFSVIWIATDHDRRMYLIKELYGCTDTPDTGVKWEPSRVARAIKDIEAQEPNLRDRKIYRVGDPAIWSSDGTESIGALMERERVYFDRGDNSRIDGKMQVHHRLAFDDEGIPMLYIFRTCRQMIRTLPALTYDETHVEDVNTKGEDHAYDALRYVCMQNPISPRPRAAAAPKPYSPLDSDEDTPFDRYEYYRR